MYGHMRDNGRFMIRVIKDQFSDIADILIIEKLGKHFVVAGFNNGFKLISEIGMFHFGTHAANLRTQVKEHRAAKQNDH